MMSMDELPAEATFSAESEFKLGLLGAQSFTPSQPLTPMSFIIQSSPTSSFCFLPWISHASGM